MSSVHLVQHEVRQHIQDHDAAETLEPHWGYADRVLPCVVDEGSCEYLDSVYGAHDIGMIYTGILWLTIGGIIFGWALLRNVGRPDNLTQVRVLDSEKQTTNAHRPGGIRRARLAAAAFIRRYLLPDAARVLFGRTTRFQVLVLAALCAYLTIWTFVGIAYKQWVTPVADMEGVYNTRTGLGPWSDRIGVLAYALTPLSVLLASRESILSLLLDVPYQSFQFLHRWLGYVIFVQSALHTIGWCIVEIRLYQPQPDVAKAWIVQEYMIWGVVAMILLTILFVCSTPWGIRLIGYETFRKTHYILAMVYIGAAWGHWVELKCFLLPSLLFWFLDRAARIVRTAFLHYHPLPAGGMGFSAVPAGMTVFPDQERGDVVRLELEHDQDVWSVGQHFYLCFTECSIWQSHPFTPLNAPIVRNGKVRHTYLLRSKTGETKNVAALAVKKLAEAGDAASAATVTTPVIMNGPYGERSMSDLNPATNIVCVAGGTGITYVLPVLLELSRQAIAPSRRIELIWAMRHASNAEWVREELDLLHKVQKALKLKIRLYATQDPRSNTPSLKEGGSSKGSVTDNKTAKGDEEITATEEVAGVSSSSSSSDDDDAIESCDCGVEVPIRKIGNTTSNFAEDRHPDLEKLVREFVEGTTAGPTTVYASGPGSMISDLRTIVAARNSAAKVWAGDEKADVRLVCDDRLEW